MFWTGFIAGLFSAAPIIILALAMCKAAKGKSDTGNIMDAHDIIGDQCETCINKSLPFHAEPCRLCWRGEKDGWEPKLC